MMWCMWSTQSLSCYKNAYFFHTRVLWELSSWWLKRMTVSGKMVGAEEKEQMRQSTEKWNRRGLHHEHNVEEFSSTLASQHPKWPHSWKPVFLVRLKFHPHYRLYNPPTNSPSCSLEAAILRTHSLLPSSYGWHLRLSHGTKDIQNYFWFLWSKWKQPPDILFYG